MWINCTYENFVDRDGGDAFEGPKYVGTLSETGPAFQNGGDQFEFGTIWTANDASVMA